MDLVYIPEVLTYGSFRSPQYRDYEQPWNQDYFNSGKYSNLTQYQRQQLYHDQNQQNRSMGKHNCHFCRENKRRSLAAYIRGKSRRSFCQEIHEEEEEKEDAENVKEKSKNSSCDEK